MTLDFKTAGESHGPAVTALVEGLPAGLKINSDDINRDLARRQFGYGRGGRMKIEKDRVDILSGVRDGKSIGSPIALLIKNKDHRTHKEEILTKPRPGHADLAGAMKFGFSDMRDVLERASARETAARCAAGALAKIFLREFSIEIVSFVLEIGGVRGSVDSLSPWTAMALAEDSPVRCPDKQATVKMVEAIEEASLNGDTLGGSFEIRALNVPPGLGSYTSWDKKLDGRMAQILMSINGIKGVEVGFGFRCASLPGSSIHDPIKSFDTPPERGPRYHRSTNRAGGFEGGVTNGEELVLRVAMKPIATLRKPLPSVDLSTGKAIEAQYERSDICAVPAASIVGETAVAFVLAQAVLEKFGGDNISDTFDAYEAYLQRLAKEF